MKTVEDFEFEALLESVAAERVLVEPPTGLAQRLMARLALAAELEAQQLTRAALPGKNAASIRSVQFRDFGVLNDGRKSRGAMLTSLLANLAIVGLVIFIGSAVRQTLKIKADKLAVITEPLAEKTPTPKPPPIKLTPPPPVPKDLPELTKQPTLDLPLDIKPVVMPEAKAALTPPAPKAVTPPPAPRNINLANASAASVPNHDAHPSPVRLGRPDSPVRSDLKGAPVSSVNLSAGMPGMPPSNNGSGPPAKNVHIGNGSPEGTDGGGKSAAPHPVVGLGNGSGIGPGMGGNSGGGVRHVEIAPQRSAAPVHPAISTTLARPPVVTFVPRPVYTEEAKALHLEGDATVKVRLMADGSVQVLGLAHGLGHGLDQSALNTARGIRFNPATDSSGKPVDFPTTVTVHFLIN